MMRWTSRLSALALILLLAPACAEQTLSQEAVVQVNQVYSLSLSSIVVSPQASVKVQDVYFNITLDNTGSWNLTNAYVYLEITDPSNNTADSVYLDNSASNYTIEPGYSLTVQHVWSNNDCPGGCTAGTYIINVTAYADSVSPQNMAKSFTISNPSPPAPPSPPSGGGGGRGMPPPSIVCVSKVVVTPGAIGLRERAPLKGLEILNLDNNGNCEETLSLSVSSGIKDLITLSKSSLTVGSGARENLTVSVYVSVPGLYKGEIEVWRDSVLLKAIPVTIIAQSSQRSLVEAEVSIDPVLRIVEVGKNVEGKITIVNLGTSEKEDVEMTISISRVGGAPLSFIEERMPIKDYTVLTRRIKAPEQAGDYALSVVVRYGGNVARASESFTVVAKKEEPTISPGLAEMVSSAVSASMQWVSDLTASSTIAGAAAALLSLLILIGIPVGAVVFTLRYLTERSKKSVAAQNAGILHEASKLLSTDQKSVSDLWKKRKVESVGKVVESKGTIAQLWKDGKL